MPVRAASSALQLLELANRGTPDPVPDDALWPSTGWDTDDDPDSRVVEEGQFRIARVREEHGYDRGAPYTAARPCQRCGGTDAFIRKVNNQNTVRCAVDNFLIYNADQTETGEKPRTVKTLRKSIKPNQQARIFERDLRRCVLCGTDELPLTIGHFVSVEEGRRLGATLQELYSDANLGVMCEACNFGLGQRSISPRLYAAIMVRLVQAEERRAMRPHATVKPPARRAVAEHSASATVEDATQPH